MSSEFERRFFLQVTLSCADGARTEIRGLKDIQGFVTIDDGVKALEFVRLFSEGGRWMLTGLSEYAEVVPGRKATPSRFVVTPDVFRTCCRPAVVREVPSSTTQRTFEVTRVVVDASYKMYLLTEIIEEDGGYQIVNREPMKQDGRRFGLFLVLDR